MATNVKLKTKIGMAPKHVNVGHGTNINKYVERTSLYPHSEMGQIITETPVNSGHPRSFSHQFLLKLSSTLQV